MNNYSLDVGPHLTSLGFTLIFVKYLLPVVIVLALIIGAYFLISHYWPKPYSPFDPIREPQTYNKSLIVIGVCVALIIIAALLT
jgi:hypothetical protein